MATFMLGYQLVAGLQPNFTFIGASYPDWDPRSGTSWVVAGPTVSYYRNGVDNPPVTLTETFWYLFGTGFDVELNALPGTGTITALVHGTPYEEFGTGLVVPPPAALDIGDVYLDRAFAVVEGLDIPASVFAAAVAAGTIADLLLAGDDLFRGYFSTNAIIPGPAWLRGGAGSDTIQGGVNSTLQGESGDDLILVPDDGTTPTQPGVIGSFLEGGTGDDTLAGCAWGDFLGGGEGVDRLDGRRGHDTLNGGMDRDVMRGGGGDDWLIVAAGEVEAGEVLDGGTGNDILFAFGDAANPLDLTETQLTGLEQIEVHGTLLMTRAQLAGFRRVDVSGFATIALADAGVTDLSVTGPWYGLSPAARLTLLGSAGRDIVNGRDTADIGPTLPGYVGYGAGDIVFGQGGNDVLNGGSGNDTLSGDAGNDLLRGDGGIDVLSGGDGADTLEAGGNPTPPFSFQNDVLQGGAGNDTYVVRHFNATIVEQPGGGIDTLVAHVAWTLPVELENLVIGGVADLNGFGNGVANRLTGNDARNNLSGAGGDDSIAGRGGNDVLGGGEGNDSLDGGEGEDALIGEAGLDRLRGGAGKDRFVFGSETDSLPTLRDQVLDFVTGEDRIDLRGFDAGPGQDGVQAFIWIGSAAFVANQPGRLRFQEVNATSCLLFGNTDDDVAPEFAVLVVGASKLSEADLLLPG